MWEYQAHFRSSAQTAASEVFDTLDTALCPRLLLLGVDIWNGRIVCDPGQGIMPAGIAELIVPSRVLEEWRAGEEQGDRKLLSQLDRHSQTTPGHLLRNLLLDQLETISETENIVSYCSYPVQVGGHAVAVMLQLSRASVLDYAQEVGTESVSYDIPHSLLNAVILEFLNACSTTLTEPEPGSKIFLLGREHAELIRAAAKHLMYKLTYLTRQWGYPISLFEACNATSSLKYEGEAGIGTMIVAEVDHPDVEVTVELRSRVPLTDPRGTRKLLQMATERMYLLSDAGYIYGLGQCSDVGTGSQGVVRIDFTGHYAWEVSYGNRSLMRVVYGQPQLPSKSINEKVFKGSVRRIFLGITESETEVLWNIALEASREPRGTIIVISTGARFEAQRLRNQCIQTKPLVPTPDVVRTITTIDGAVLLAPGGTCYAVGVILDGLASSKGNPMRGSRYNSAVRYVETSRRQFGYGCYAIIVSEDGMVDLVPELVPEIPRTAIDEQVERLRAVADAATIDYEEFYTAMDWLQRHRAYLVPDIVDELNRLLRQLGPSLGEEAGTWLPFTVDPGIDESSLTGS